ncbi:MAG: L-serine ammonia-lyase, iron-sulfur-dependent, subunit alpha [Peptococcaceae bacterium]|jgi:L-cysteine desulfidase/DNA-binding Xre family transcriptional regulator|nr:L-serine ammonia-lyase, iron-sulfur-dependent, subunit alpha [Peptococcaceae bacterium]
MMINYNRLFKTLTDRGIKKMDLKNAAGIGTSTLAKLSHNQPVAMEVMVRICSVLNCNIGDIMDIIPDKMDSIAACYTQILKEELLPSVGCTEPNTLAFAAAKAREILGALPDRCVVELSGNMFKNTKSVAVPNTGGMKGVYAAVAAGLIAGKAGSGLEVLADITEGQRTELKEYIDSHYIEIVLREQVGTLYVSLYARAGGESARVTIDGGHLHIVGIEKNDEIIFEAEREEELKSQSKYYLLNIEDIVQYANTVDLGELRPLLERQADYNRAIAEEGLAGDWGANVGKSILATFGNGIQFRAAAAAAAGCDARMGGCGMPVIIMSGSGNQGLAVSLPVITYADEIKCPKDELYRALIAANLATVHQKTSIGKLSAFCGAVSASCAAAAGVAYLLGGDYEIISHTIVNALAIVSGIVCDGAKPSCAGKIGVAVLTGLLGYNLFAEMNQQFYGGDGILSQGVDKTISNVGDMASKGMRETDIEIIKIMTENC